MRLSTCAVVVLLAAVAAAAPPNDVAADAFEAEVVQKLNSACANRETSACIKLKVITYMNRLLKKASIEVTEDVVLTQNAEAVPEIFVPTTPREIGAQDAFGLMAAKARNFIKSRELHWNVAPETDVVVSTDKDVSNINVRFAVDSGRASETARLHKIKSLFAIGAAAIAKISVVAIVKFVALAILVFKALIVSKLALAAAVILGVSRLLSHHGGGHSVTYEVVSHPHHTSVDHHDTYSAGSVGYSSGGASSGGSYSDGGSYSSGSSSGGGYARADHVSPYRAHAPARKPAHA